VGSISAAQFCVKPQELKHFWPLLQLGTASLDPQIATENLIEDISQVLVDSAFKKLQSISTDAESFLRGHSEISMSLNKALNCLGDLLGNVGIPYSISAGYQQDSEAPHFETIEVIVKVDLEDFDKILELWKLADERAYAILNGAASDRIIVMFERL
jgi:hypothetical protein